MGNRETQRTTISLSALDQALLDAIQESLKTEMGFVPSRQQTLNWCLALLAEKSLMKRISKDLPRPRERKRDGLWRGQEFRFTPEQEEQMERMGERLAAHLDDQSLKKRSPLIGYALYLSARQLGINVRRVEAERVAKQATDSLLETLLGNMALMEGEEE